MSELFPVLDPPPGGLARLRARLDREERPGWGWVGRALVPLAATAAVAALFALGLPGGLRPRVEAFDFAVPAERVSVAANDPHPPVLVQLPSSDPHVVIYAVAPTDDLEAR
jgi:hypothetical protein